MRRTLRWSWWQTAARLSRRWSDSGQVSLLMTALLDVVVMRANNFSQSVRAVWDLLRIAPGALGEGGYVGYARGREVRVESDPVQPVQLDGEPGGETPFNASVIPGAIKVMVPVGR